MEERRKVDIVEDEDDGSGMCSNEGIDLYSERDSLSSSNSFSSVEISFEMSTNSA